MTKLQVGNIVRFQTDYATHGLTHLRLSVHPGDVGIVTVESMTGWIVRWGNPAEDNSLCVLYADAPAVLRRVRARVASDGDPLAFWSAHWQEYEPETRVLFRWWKGGVGDEPSLIALFPDDPGDMNPVTCASFQHVGQHGAARLHWIISSSRPATEAEYAPLKRELESAPYFYRLKVMKRTPADSYQKRVDALRAPLAASGA